MTAPPGTGAAPEAVQQIRDSALLAGPRKISRSPGTSDSIRWVRQVFTDRDISVYISPGRYSLIEIYVLHQMAGIH